MFKFNFDKKPIVENSQIIDVSVFIRHNYLAFKDNSKNLGKEVNLDSEEDVNLFIKYVETCITVNLRQDNNGQILKTEYLNKIKLTFTKSNLNNGFIFWFICNLCGRRVRFLYFPPNSDIMACRNCHRLTYRKQRLNYPKIRHRF